MTKFSSDPKTFLKKISLILAVLPFLLFYQNCGVMVQGGSGNSAADGSSNLGGQNIYDPGNVYEPPPPPGTPGSPSTPTNPSNPGSNPAFSKFAATNFTNQQGMMADAGGGYLGYIDSGDYVHYANVDFESGVQRILLELALGNDGAGGNVQIVLDSATGPVIGEAQVQVTGGWESFTTQTVTLNQVTGVHSLYIRFTGGSGVGNLKSWQLQK